MKERLPELLNANHWSVHQMVHVCSGCQLRLFISLLCLTKAINPSLREKSALTRYVVCGTSAATVLFVGLKNQLLKSGLLVESRKNFQAQSNNCARKSYVIGLCTRSLKLTTQPANLPHLVTTRFELIHGKLPGYTCPTQILRRGVSAVTDINLSPTVCRRVSLLKR